LLIAGSSVEHAGFNRQVEPAIVADLRARAALILPHLGQASPSEVWTGFRPASDALHVGRWQSGRIYLAYGHYRNGILLAPGTARRLADEISASLQTRWSAGGALLG
jgi:glycine oxidase